MNTKRRLFKDGQRIKFAAASNLLMIIDDIFISGQISIVSSSGLDYEARSKYLVEITTQDPAGLSTSANLTLNVLDVQEAPVFHNLPATITMEENKPSGSVVFSADASDPDGDALLYSMVTSPNTTVFLIDTSSKSSHSEFR